MSVQFGTFSPRAKAIKFAKKFLANYFAPAAAPEKYPVVTPVKRQ